MNSLKTYELRLCWRFFYGLLQFTINEVCCSVFFSLRKERWTMPLIQVYLHCFDLDCSLFIDDQKLDAEVKHHLQLNGTDSAIQVTSYDKVGEVIKNLVDQVEGKFWVRSRSNRWSAVFHSFYEDLVHSLCENPNFFFSDQSQVQCGLNSVCRESMILLFTLYWWILCKILNIV